MFYIALGSAWPSPSEASELQWHVVQLHPFWANPTLRAERSPLTVAKLMINSRRLRRVLITEAVVVTQRGGMNAARTIHRGCDLLSKMSELLPVANDALLILREVETNLFN